MWVEINFLAGPRKNPCYDKYDGRKNAGCSDICKPSEENMYEPECSCPEGKVLVDEKNCGKMLKLIWPCIIY